MDITFRKLTAKDKTIALAMNTTFREGFFTCAGADHFLDDDRNWLFAGLLDGEVIAFALGYELPRPDGRTMLYVHEVGVADAHRRRGIGTALLQALKSACISRGICRFFLFTPQRNAAANALYRKCGGETGWESHGNDTAYYFQTENDA